MHILKKGTETKLHNGDVTRKEYELRGPDAECSFSFFEYHGQSDNPDIELGVCLSSIHGYNGSGRLDIDIVRSLGYDRAVRSTSIYKHVFGYTPTTPKIEITEDYRKNILIPFTKVVDKLEQDGTLLNLSDWKTTKDLDKEAAENEAKKKEEPTAKRGRPRKTTPAPADANKASNPEPTDPPKVEKTPDAKAS